MRIYLKLSINKEVIPFNYQPFLTSAIHKWIGPNNTVHGALSLFSFSWLQNVSVVEKKGIALTKDSYLFISAHDDSLIKQIVKGIGNNPSVAFGIQVSEIQIVDTPFFEKTKAFFTASPVFIKRRINENEKHITFEDPSSDQFLTETFQKKLQAAQLPYENVRIEFDRTFANPRTKIIRYKEVASRVSVCPVIVNGTAEQIGFAWNVGIGNSTGIGFGSLK